MQIDIANDLGELPVAIAAMERFAVEAALEDEVSQALAVVLDELLNNIISYGYRDSRTHRISLEFRCDNHSVTVVIVDDATAFNPFEREAPDINQSIEDREPGGVGIHIVKKLMDDCAHERRGERNIVTLVKRLD